MKAVSLFLSAIIISTTLASLSARGDSHEKSLLKSASNSQQDNHTIPQSDLVYMKTELGDVVLQLTALQSPNAAKKFKNLVNEGFYDGLNFYRVIDGFVAQGGEEQVAKDKRKPSSFRDVIDAEFTASVTDNSGFQVEQSPALLAPETGYWHGFPAGRDLTTKEQWLLHCPGAVALARDLKPNTQSTEFYIVIGQAPRHLDRNMSVIGRVIDGLDIAQKMPRGDRAKGGVIDNAKQRTVITSARMGDKVNAEEQITFAVENTNSEKFQQRLKKSRHNTGPFLVYPGTGNIDVCYYQPRITKNP